MSSPSIQAQLAKAVIDSTEAQTYTAEDGTTYTAQSCGDVSVVRDESGKRLIGLNLVVGPLELTYSDSGYAIDDGEEVYTLTDEALIAHVNEFVVWRTKLLQQFNL